MALIHLEGMGWLGSLVAHQLADDGVAFTWHDIDSPWVAWRASTGCVYPSGEPREARDHADWLRWVDKAWWPPGAVEPVAYWFSHKAPPHGARCRLAGDLGWARLADIAAVQVDVPRVVEATRETYAARRRPGPPAEPHLLVRAHGFTERQKAYLWGFSAEVALEVDPALIEVCPLRPSFYANAGRNQVAYAYAAPGRPGVWLAGSSRCYQRQPRELDAARHFERWERQFTAAFEGRLRVRTVGAYRQGWRPRPANADTGKPTVRPRRGNGPEVVLPPMCGNGVRCAPTLLAEVRQALARAGA